LEGHRRLKAAAYSRLQPTIIPKEIIYGRDFLKEVSKEKRCKAFFGGRRLWTMPLFSKKPFAKAKVFYEKEGHLWELI